MQFIGRKTELAALEEEYRRDGSLVVIYGRRRVGKTTLIKEFIKDKKAFYYLATKEVEKLAMRRFAGVLSRGMDKPSLQRTGFSDWLDLFAVVADYEPREKKVIVIDELPYLCKTNPAFPSILQNAWDELLKDSNCMLILCGSLISMMKKHTLYEDSPLYGRRTAQIRLMPLPFTDVYESQNRTFTEAVERYAVTGGVPKYLEFFPEATPLREAISNVVLSRNGFLYEEPCFLLNEEVNSPTSYFSILRTVAEGCHKLGNIAGVLELETSSLTPYLSTLIELGILKKDVPITEKDPNRSRKGLYFIADPFISFWFRYVYPYKGELELDNQQIVEEEMRKDFISSFVAMQYEDICRDIFANLCKTGRVDFSPSRIGSYWLNDVSGNTQIDVMAVDKKNKRLFAGECKYHEKPIDADVYFDLQKKVADSKEIRNTFPEYAMLYGIFSKSGFTRRLMELAAGNENLFLIQEDQVLSV